MNTREVEAVANAVLYEGYLLYPYRPSALKNQKRFNFGVVYPRPASEALPGAEVSAIETQCLTTGDARTHLDVKVRFLQLVACAPGELATGASGRQAGSGEGWHEAIERDVDVRACAFSEITAQPLRREFSFPAKLDEGPSCGAGGEATEETIRTGQPIQGDVVIAARKLADGLFKISARVSNLASLGETKSREEALLRSLVSTHTILTVEGGEFVSMLDPPEAFKEAVAGCRNTGTYPVLAGEEGRRDTMLSSPIILYDYPEIAAESAGDFFDSTEIDEMLALRVMTLTEDEKREMRGTDERARRILERTETLPPEHWMKLHGALRRLRSVSKGPI